MKGNYCNLTGMGKIHFGRKWSRPSVYTVYAQKLNRFRRSVGRSKENNINDIEYREKSLVILYVYTF